MTSRQRNRLLTGVILTSFLCAVLVLLSLTAIQQWGGSIAASAGGDTDANTASIVSGKSPTTYTPPELDVDAKPISASDLSPNAQTLHNENYGVTLLPPFSLSAEGKLRIDFANPMENAVWLLMDLRLASNHQLLYRTGRIAPGQALSSLPLSTEAADILRQQGTGTEVSLTIYSFEIKSFVSMGEINMNAPIVF